jgi:uridine kinase
MLIHVTGASGSGTSTLGTALASELGGVHIEADDYFWLPTSPPFTTKRDRVECLSSLLSDLRAEEVAVLAGSIVDWGAELEDSFGLIVFLYLDAETRIERLRKRELERFGHVNPAFLEWAAQYDEGPPEGRSLAKHRTWLGARSCPIIELSGNLSVAERVAAVLKEAPNPSIKRDALKRAPYVKR